MVLSWVWKTWKKKSYYSEIAEHWVWQMFILKCIYAYAEQIQSIVKLCNANFNIKNVHFPTYYF